MVEGVDMQQGVVRGRGSSSAAVVDQVEKVEHPTCLTDNRVRKEMLR